MNQVVKRFHSLIYWFHFWESILRKFLKYKNEKYMPMLTRAIFFSLPEFGFY
jgi:hypothetical protein